MTDEMMKQKELARQVLDNEMFRFVLGATINSLDEQMNGLNPTEKELFSIIRAQQLILESIKMTFINAANMDDSAEEDNKEYELEEGDVL